MSAGCGIIRAVQAPVPSLPPEPSWLGNAQAGLIVAAILGVGYGWTNRRRVLGKLALVASCVASALVVYFSFFRGYSIALPSAPEFVVRSVPAWKPFLLGLSVPLGLATAFYGWRYFRRSPSTHAAIWNSLSNDEKTALWTAWNQEDGILNDRDVANARDFFGNPRWNAALHVLLTRNLFEEYGYGLRLTDSARETLRHVRRAPEGEMPNAAPPLPGLE